MNISVVFLKTNLALFLIPLHSKYVDITIQSVCTFLCTWIENEPNKQYITLHEMRLKQVFSPAEGYIKKDWRERGELKLSPFLFSPTSYWEYLRKIDPQDVITFKPLCE